MAKLMFYSGPYEGKSVGIPQGKSVTLGRNRDLELPLPDLKLSRLHCQISFKEDRYVLKDLNSTNGTFVNGERVKGEVVLNDFDRIVVGDIEMEFHYSEKVPLPFGFNSAASDPFGLGEDENEVDLASLQQLDDEPQEALAPRAALETGLRTATPVSPRKSSNTDIVPGTTPAPVAGQARPPARAGMPQLHALVELPGSSASKAKTPSGIQRVAVALAPDLLEAAFRDLDTPLPPEPPPLRVAVQAAEARPELMFCVVCEGSIPTLDYDLGIARLVDGRMVCGECLARGARPAAAAAAPRTVAAARAEERKKSVDDILKALDEEAVIIDTTQKPGSGVAPGAGGAGNKAVPKDVPKELGEEFEEIG